MPALRNCFTWQQSNLHKRLSTHELHCRKTTCEPTIRWPNFQHSASNSRRTSCSIRCTCTHPEQQCDPKHHHASNMPLAVCFRLHASICITGSTIIRSIFRSMQLSFLYDASSSSFKLDRALPDLFMIPSMRARAQASFSVTAAATFPATSPEMKQSSSVEVGNQKHLIVGLTFALACIISFRDFAIHIQCNSTRQ